MSANQAVRPLLISYRMDHYEFGEYRDVYIYVYGNNFSKNKEMNIWIEYEKGLSYPLPVVTDSHGGFGVLAIKYRCSGYPKTLGLDIVARDGWNFARNTDIKRSKSLIDTTYEQYLEIDFLHQFRILGVNPPL